MASFYDFFHKYKRYTAGPVDVHVTSVLSPGGYRLTHSLVTVFIRVHPWYEHRSEVRRGPDGCLLSGMGMSNKRNSTINSIQQ